LNGNFVLNKGN